MWSRRREPSVIALCRRRGHDHYSEISSRVQASELGGMGVKQDCSRNPRDVCKDCSRDPKDVGALQQI